MTTIRASLMIAFLSLRSLAVSRSTVHRDLNMAKAWINDRLDS